MALIYSAVNKKDLIFYNAFISSNRSLQPPLWSPECHYDSLFLSGANHFFSYAINPVVIVFPLSQKFLFWKSQSILIGGLGGGEPDLLSFPQSNQMTAFSAWQSPDLDNRKIRQLFLRCQTRRTLKPWQLSQTAFATLTQSIRRFFLPETPNTSHLPKPIKS